MNPAPLTGLDLHDIHAAPAPEFWPPAPGWWILAGLLLLLLGFVIWRLLAVWRRYRRRNSVLLELDTIALKHADEIASQVSILLRRVALLCYQRQRVASLSGHDWLEFLDATGGDGAFVNGCGKVLATAPYAVSSHLSDNDKEQLISLARQWINRNMRHYS